MKHLKTFEQHDINEGLISDKFEAIFSKYRSKIKDGLKKFVESMRQEGKETKTAGAYVNKYLKGEELTDEENEAVRQQFYDILKMVGIGVPMAILPGGSILLPIIIKFAAKNNIKLTPSSFKAGGQ